MKPTIWIQPPLLHFDRDGAIRPPESDPLSLWDRYAIAAVQGLCSDRDTMPETIAELSAEVADWMMGERAQRMHPPTEGDA